MWMSAMLPLHILSLYTDCIYICVFGHVIMVYIHKIYRDFFLQVNVFSLTLLHSTVCRIEINSYSLTSFFQIYVKIVYENCFMTANLKYFISKFSLKQLFH